jgi:hypothetical protein
MCFNKFYKIWFSTSLIILFIISGCTVKHIHSVTIFEIQGQVFDKQSNLPLENVKVSFIDTGYDYVRSKKPLPIEIGQSDSNGLIKARFNYLWAHQDFIFYGPPKETFQIVLSKKLYAPRRFNFDESKLESDAFIFEVNLEEVYMVPINKINN